MIGIEEATTLTSRKYQDITTRCRTSKPNWRRDGDGNTFVLDEHAERSWLPQRHAAAIKTMVARHRVPITTSWTKIEKPRTRPLELSDLKRFVAGADVTSAIAPQTVPKSQPRLEKPLTVWCRWWDLNPHDFLRSQDFKSCASAISPHRQREAP